PSLRMTMSPIAPARSLLLALAFTVAAAAMTPVTAPVWAQGRPGAAPAPQRPASGNGSGNGGGEGIRIIPDTAISNTDAVTIKGRSVPYRVTVGTQPAFDNENNPVASLFYTYYERTDVTDRASRPLVISFNGGPGSASVWMHIAYTGPKQLRIDEEGYPVQPYGVQDNPHSILDVADIVYIDPVNTGFSRILGDAKREQFFGVNEDIAYLARWLDAFVARQGRWTSPKYLIGESYGTTRVSGLVQR